MLDPERLLGQMLSGSLGGALGGKSHKRHKHRSGGLGGLLGGNTAAKAQLGVGLLGIAMAAWEHYSSQPKREAAAMASVPQALASAAPPPPPPPPPTGLAGDATRPAPMLDMRRQQAVLLIRAMIAAAAADGAIDDAERAAILDRARKLGDDAQTLDFLRAELDAPLGSEELVAQTPRSLSNEVYAAAALAITIDTEAERAWLSRLAVRLGIDPETRDTLHREIGLVD